MRGFVVLVWNTSSGVIVSVTKFQHEEQARTWAAAQALIANQATVTLEGR
jgi:hypothetical protein